MTVPVALSDLGIADLPPRRATHRVGISGEQGVDKRRQHLTHQVRRRLGQVLVQKVSRVNTKGAVIAVVLFELALEGLSKDHAVTASSSTTTTTTHSPCYRYTTLQDSTRGHLRLRARRR